LASLLTRFQAEQDMNDSKQENMTGWYPQKQFITLSTVICHIWRDCCCTSIMGTRKENDNPKDQKFVVIYRESLKDQYIFVQEEVDEILNLIVSFLGHINEEPPHELIEKRGIFSLKKPKH